MKKLSATALGICSGLCVMTTALAYEDGDRQFWSTVSIVGNLHENWEVKLDEEFRFGDAMRYLYYHHTDGGVTYRLTHWSDLSLNYRQIYEKKVGEWKQEKRPHINGTMKRTWQGFSLRMRSRFEYRIRHEKDAVWRNRNKLSLVLPFKKTRFDAQPFLADEIFIELDKGELSRNRFYLGLKVRLAKNLKTDISYLWQTDRKDGDWIDYHVIGTKLKLEF